MICRYKPDLSLTTIQVSSSPSAAASNKVMTSSLSASVTQPSAPPSTQSEPNYSSITSHHSESEVCKSNTLLDIVIISCV